MPDKPFAQLGEIDRDLRRALPPSERTGVQVTIEKLCGFELFNTRPYHNYETFSDGYRVYDDEVDVRAEDLDDAVSLFLRIKAMDPAARGLQYRAKGSGDVVASDPCREALEDIERHADMPDGEDFERAYVEVTQIARDALEALRSAPHAAP